MRKKTTIILINLLLIVSSNLIGQVESPPTSISNQVFLEVGGLGVYGSVNYERFILKNKNVGVRAGLSTYNFVDFNGNFNPDLVLPYGVSYFKGNRYKLEVGIGQTVTSVVTIDEESWGPKRTYRVHGNFTIGFRYQKKEKGLIFRCAYSPMIQDYSKYKNWALISIGYGF
jgi:hypothetical protein